MGILLNLTKEYFKNDIRNEEGIFVYLNGKKYILRYEDHEHLKNLIPLNDKGDLFVETDFNGILKNPVYICCTFTKAKNKYYHDHYEYHYYTKGQLDKVEGNIITEEMIFWIDSTYNIFSDNFLIFEIIKNTIDDINFYLETTIYKYDCYYTFEQIGDKEIRIYFNEEEIKKDAEYKCIDSLNNDFLDDMPVYDFTKYRKKYGDEWITMSGDIDEYCEKNTEIESDMYDIEKLAELCVEKDGYWYWLDISGKKRVYEKDGEKYFVSDIEQ